MNGKVVVWVIAVECRNGATGRLARGRLPPAATFLADAIRRELEGTSDLQCRTDELKGTRPEAYSSCNSGCGSCSLALANRGEFVALFL
jgi:hypothetical protein